MAIRHLEAAKAGEQIAKNGLKKFGPLGKLLNKSVHFYWTTSILSGFLFIAYSNP
ncbi:MAG: hypothetical protein R6V20_05890 [Desulfobia sp.]